MFKKPKLTAIFIVAFVDFLGLSFVLPLYPELTDKFGLSALSVTLLAASYALMQFLFSPFFGRLSDRFGRKPLLLISALGTAVSFLLFGLAHSVWLLFASRILNGITGSSVAVAQAYVADVTPPEKRAHGMGLIGVALGLGFIFGPALAGVLGRYGFGAPAFAAAVVSLFNFFLILFGLEESLKKEFRFKHIAQKWSAKKEVFLEAWRQPVMADMIATYFWVMVAFSAMQNVAGLFGKERFHFTLQENGYFFAYLGVLMIIVQGLLVSKLAKLVGESVVIIMGIILMLLGYFLAPFSEHIWTIALFGGLISCGAGLYNPAINSLMSKNASPSEQGSTFGVVQSILGVALVVGPVIAGLMFDVFGSGSPFFMAGAIMILSLFSAVRVFRKLKQIEKVNFFPHN